MWTKLVRDFFLSKTSDIVINVIFFVVISDFNGPLERIKTIQTQMTKLSVELKRCVVDCKEIYLKHLERLQRERDTALLAASQIEDPNNINAQLPPGVEISNKKVILYKTIDFFSSIRFIKQIVFIFSVQIVIVMPWLNVHFVVELLIVPPSVSAKTG